MNLTEHNANCKKLIWNNTYAQIICFKQTSLLDCIFHWEKKSTRVKEENYHQNCQDNGYHKPVVTGRVQYGEKM